MFRPSASLLILSYVEAFFPLAKFAKHAKSLICIFIGGINKLQAPFFKNTSNAICMDANRPAPTFRMN